MKTKYITDIKQASTILADNNIKLVTFEHNIGYDTGLSQMYYDDFISNANGCHDIQKFDDYIVIYGNDVSRNDAHFNEDEIVLLSDDELNNLSYSLGLSCDVDDKNDLIDELLSLDHEDYYNKYYAETYYRDLEYSFSFSGYSQGDNYKVQTVGKVETWLTDNYLTNIFYDAPISGVIDVYINGDLAEEISAIEFIQDEYGSWDKEEFIQDLSINFNGEYKDLLIEYLQNNLPKHLEYN